MNTEQRVEQLIALGFDNTHIHDSDEDIHISCSQCQAMTIQGVPCHESGCPNETHECAECNAQIKKGMRLCESCANPEPYICPDVWMGSEITS